MAENFESQDVRRDRASEWCIFIAKLGSDILEPLLLNRTMRMDFDFVSPWATAPIVG